MAMFEIYNMDEFVAMLAMKRELHLSRFIYSLDKTYPKSYSKLLAYVQKYIRAKEGAVIQREDNNKSRKK